MLFQNTFPSAPLQREGRASGLYAIPLAVHQKKKEQFILKQVISPSCPLIKRIYTDQKEKFYLNKDYEVDFYTGSRTVS